MVFLRDHALVQIPGLRLGVKSPGSHVLKENSDKGEVQAWSRLLLSHGSLAPDWASYRFHEFRTS